MLDAERFLSEIEPFAHLSKEEIQDLVDSFGVEYYKRGEIIFKEDMEPLKYLYLLRSGVVALEKAGEALEYLYEGDTFGYTSLVSGEAPPFTARALEETVVFLLPAEKFLALFKKNDYFREFYTKKLSNGILIRKTQITPFLTAESHMDTTLEDLELRPLIIFDPHQSVAEAVREMIQRDSTYVLVRLPEHMGIITERDVLKKVIVSGHDPKKVTLAEIVTYPIISLDSRATLYEAILLMSRHGIRKLLVTKDEKPIGVIEERDVILHESKNAVTLTKEIDKAKSIEELKYLYNLLRDHAIEQIFQGADPEKLARYISEINDRFMRRAVDFTIKVLGEEPKSPFSILVLGSEGRREQSLKTDQDNALIFQEYKEDTFEARNYFDRFSQVYIDTLLQIGFPPCPGEVMLNNPFWRRSLKEWKATVDNWMNNPKPENTLKIAIFFDFRNIYGDENLSRELWSQIASIMKINIAFVRFLAHDAVNFKPPLGLFKDFIVEKTGVHSGELDLKKGGIFPITQGVRALALEAGIRVQNTFERIKELQLRNVFNAEYAKDLTEAYRFLLGLRFKFQARKIKENKDPDNYINPAQLSRAERGILRDIFRFIKGFQDYLRDRYKLMYF